MKTSRFFLLLFAFVLQFLPCAGYAQSPIQGYDDFPVPIDEEHFPDGIFRGIVKGLDSDNDNKLSLSEVTAVDSLDIDNRGIENLEGIKYCFALEFLDCNNNWLTNLDVSGCTALMSLSCDSNLLMSLEVSDCVALTDLSCERNRLSSLDVSSCTALKNLSCASNRLSSLDVSSCTALKNLSCRVNRFSSLDVSNCIALENLSCGSGQLSSLDASGCTALENLFCGSGQLTSLDVSGCTALKDLDCRDNQLTKLDMTGCTALESLVCDHNQLTSLIVWGGENFHFLSCKFNCIRVLDMSNCGFQLGTMIYIDFRDNQLSHLDLSHWLGDNGYGIGINPISDRNICPVEVDAFSRFDLTSLPGFDVKRVSALEGGSLDGNILTFYQDRVTYLYDLFGNGKYELEFSLQVSEVGNEILENQLPGRVYAQDRTIFTEGIRGEVSVYTILGTLVYHGQNNRISVPRSGVYIVRNNELFWKLLVK